MSLHELLSADDYKINDIKPSDWAEDRRVMSSDVSAFPGNFSYNRTPYLRELVDLLSESTPVEKFAIIKGAQIGVSTGLIENGIGWIIDQNPAPILLLTATKELSKKSITTKIDQMIESCGLRDKIRPNTIKRKNARTGDTDTLKEFEGGRLSTGSSSDHLSARQESFKIIFFDDFETAPMSTDQSGDTVTLFEQRAASFGHNRKIGYISTPELKQTSNIYPLYKKGDQRKYHVPCPCCGSYIVLEWRTKQKNGRFAGITYKLDSNNELIEESVGYTCQDCGETFKERHKYNINLAGEWRPTAKSSDKRMRSYHISALYAPPGMYDWTHYVKQYLEACPPEGNINQAKYKTFVNLVLGMPWEQTGDAPKAKVLSKNTRRYEVGEVPTVLSRDDGNGEVVMITCAADLGGYVDDAVLEYEIVAWTEKQSSYSIDQGAIGTFRMKKEKEKKGDRKKFTYRLNEENSVWNDFLDVIRSKYPTQDNTSVKIQITGIDSGYFTKYVYDFCEYCSTLGINVFALKGDKPDDYRRMSLDTPLWKQGREKSFLFLAEVNLIKEELSPLVALKWNARQGIDQPMGFMNFPDPGQSGKYSMKGYFNHFGSEHRVLEEGKNGEFTGYLWKKRNSSVQNHFWDVRVYNIAIREIFMYQVCKLLKYKRVTWSAYCSIVLKS